MKDFNIPKWKIVADTFRQAVEAMQKARACPIVDDDFPALLHKADSEMESAMRLYEAALKDPQE